MPSSRLVLPGSPFFDSKVFFLNANKLVEGLCNETFFGHTGHRGGGVERTSVVFEKTQQRRRQWQITK
jgi:hypothetical protein